MKSKYDPKHSVIKNIKLPPTLLSRFDLIYLMLDRITTAGDRKLSSHILNLYSERKDNEMEIEEESNKISRSLMSKYISYAR